MTRAAAALHALTHMLHGELAEPVDWTAVIDLANRSWLTPTLYGSLASSARLGEVPDDVRDYLTFIHDRNRDRNARLRGQLLDAIIALNEIGIRPVLLKGAIGLLTSPEARLGCRLMSDLDIGIEPACFATANARLLELGYQPVDGDRSLARPGDAAMLEPRPYMFEASDLRLAAHGTNACTWLPSPTDQALHLIRHDMLKEGDYWRGRIDLRHLYDLALLADTAEGIDWRCLRAAMRGNPERNALETQLLTLQALFGTDIPAPAARLSLAGFQCWRRMHIATHPAAAAPLRIAGNMLWGWKRMRSVDDLHQHGITDLLLRARRVLAETSSGPKV